MPDPNYPTGALEALAAALAKRSCLQYRHLKPSNQEWWQREARDMLSDALVAMPPEDCAALARWVWPEGHPPIAVRGIYTQPGGPDAVK